MHKECANERTLKQSKGPFTIPVNNSVAGIALGNALARAFDRAARVKTSVALPERILSGAGGGGSSEGRRRGALVGAPWTAGGAVGGWTPPPGAPWAPLRMRRTAQAGAGDVAHAAGRCWRGTSCPRGSGRRPLGVVEGLVNEIILTREVGEPMVLTRYLHPPPCIAGSRRCCAAPDPAPHRTQGLLRVTGRDVIEWEEATLAGDSRRCTRRWPSSARTPGDTRGSRSRPRVSLQVRGCLPSQGSYLAVGLRCASARGVRPPARGTTMADRPAAEQAEISPSL